MEPLMRLAEFILANVEPILAEWEAFARGMKPGAAMDSLALRDHAEDILRATAGDMVSAQSDVQRAEKSRGRHAPAARAAPAAPAVLAAGAAPAERIRAAGAPGNGDWTDAADADGVTLNGASESHAVGRLGSGFDLLEMVSEYRALRASVLRLWSESGPSPAERDVDDLTRFNESIDQSITRAVASFTRRVDQSRDLFLAILSHDLRNPLNSIAMSAEMLPRLPRLVSAEPEAVGLAAQIATNAQVMGRMIGDLLDYTRTRLGAGMPVERAAMDLGALCRELFDEFRTAHPTRHVRFYCTGDCRGHWDGDRLRQAVSNLMGNALQHGADDAQVELRVDGGTDAGRDSDEGGEGGEVLVIVHNDGPPIPAGEITKIFDPLVRGSSAQHPKKNRPGSIGLGLYIAREVAKSHGGTIVATSTAASGTAFTVRLPRRSRRASEQPILDEKHLQTM